MVLTRIVAWCGTGKYSCSVDIRSWLSPSCSIFLGSQSKISYLTSIFPNYSLLCNDLH